MDGKLRRLLEKALSELDENGATGPRLLDDAQRIWRRTQRFIKLGLIAAEPDLLPLELACFALQLPQRQLAPAGKIGRSNLKQRAEQAAEILVGQFGDAIDESLLDRTTRMLHEMPQRQPIIEEARLLADAVNLDDFGGIGLIQLAIQLGQQGNGAGQLIESLAKRDAYGYWEARLKDSFHFPAVREMARRRLAQTRTIAEILNEENRDDSP